MLARAWASGPLLALLILICFHAFFCQRAHFSCDLALLNYGVQLEGVRHLLICLTLVIMGLRLAFQAEAQPPTPMTKALFRGLTLSLIFSFSVASLLSFYIIFELSLIPMLFIIMGGGYQPERWRASLALLIYTMVSSLPLLLLFI